MKNERDFQTKFRDWLAYNWHGGTAAFELKFIKDKNAIPFSNVKLHQIRGLKLAQKRLIWKISDMSIEQKPFDCFILVKAFAFVVICWNDGSGYFYIINVDDFEKEKETSLRKSLSIERASEIGIKYKL